MTMQGRVDRSEPGVLSVGTPVEVRTRYRGSWTEGFEVARTTEHGYWVRRASDRCLLPAPFHSDEIRHCRWLAWRDGQPPPGLV